MESYDKECDWCQKEKWSIATVFGVLCKDCLTLHSRIVNDAKKELSEFIKKNKEDV